MATEAAAFRIEVIGMMFNRARGFGLALAAAGPLAVGVAGEASGVPSRSAATTCQSPTVQPPNVSSSFNSLSGVAVTSNCEAWAVGQHYDLADHLWRDLILHWNGTGWEVQVSRGGFMNAVAATSPSNAWAVGEGIQHWNGRAWRVQKDQLGGGEAVTATSAHNAWSVEGSAIEHWNGRAWRVQKNPNPGATRGFYNQLYGVAATSATNAWAVGFHSRNTGDQPTNAEYQRRLGKATDRTLIEHWNGRVWTIQKSPSPGFLKGTDNTLKAVAATSPTNAWAVGMDTPHRRGAHGGSLILHWNGTAWKREKSPIPCDLSGVAATSRTNAWAVGGYFDANLIGHPVILRWNGTAWKVQHSPLQPSPAPAPSLASVAATSRANAWVVGSYGVGNPAKVQTLALHWDGTTWSP